MSLCIHDVCNIITSSSYFSPEFGFTTTRHSHELSASNLWIRALIQGPLKCKILAHYIICVPICVFIESDNIVCLSLLIHSAIPEATDIVLWWI